LILAAFYPGEAWRALRFAAESLVLVSPMIILGMLLTALVVASGGTALIGRAFQGHQSGMILAASLIGALTPVCGITVLPLVAGLLASGVPLAPIMAFWLASPITDPGMLTVTAGTIGLDFALGKSLAAFAIGLFGGFAILLLQGLGGKARTLAASPLRRGGKAMEMLCKSGSGCSAESFTWRFWRESGRRQAFAGSLRATGKLMIVWLSLAFLAEYFLRAYLPAELFADFVGAESYGAVPLAAAIGAPLYLDAYGALPLIRGLMEKGMAPGAAMAFLVSGGIVSAYAAIPVYALVRLPVFLIYLLLAVFGAMLAGWGYGLFAG
jgi:uncharacterized membrane protein YraQ (UPF0718 family)